MKLNSSARACNPQASSLLPHCSSPARKIESFYATAEDPNAASSNTESSFADPTAVMASINRSKNAEKENALQKRLPNYCSETLLPVLSSTSLFRDLQQKHRPSKKEYPNIDCPATRLGLAATTATTSCTTTATTTATFEDSSTVSPDQHAEHQIVPALRHQLAGQHGSFSRTSAACPCCGVVNRFTAAIVRPCAFYHTVLCIHFRTRLPRRSVLRVNYRAYGNKRRHQKAAFFEKGITKSRYSVAKRGTSKIPVLCPSGGGKAGPISHVSQGDTNRKHQGCATAKLYAKEQSVSSSKPSSFAKTFRKTTKAAMFCSSLRL